MSAKATNGARKLNKRAAKLFVFNGLKAAIAETSNQLPPRNRIQLALFGLSKGTTKVTNVPKPSNLTDSRRKNCRAISYLSSAAKTRNVKLGILAVERRCRAFFRPVKESQSWQKSISGL